MNIGVAAALAKALGSGSSSPSGGGGATVVELTYADDVYTSTMKAGPLWEAAQAGPVIFRDATDEFGVVTISSLIYASVTEEDGQASDFYFVFSPGRISVTLSAATADDYPTSD